MDTIKKALVLTSAQKQPKLFSAIAAARLGQGVRATGAPSTGATHNAAVRGR